MYYIIFLGKIDIYRVTVQNLLRLILLSLNMSLFVTIHYPGAMLKNAVKIYERTCLLLIIPVKYITHS